MYRLSQIIIPIIVILAIIGFGFSFNFFDSPHGTDFKTNCTVCHTTDGWTFSADNTFNHDSTNYLLSGQHKDTKCLSCHKSLVFSEAGSSCTDCHTDIHQQTVGDECNRCHTPQSWLVTNISELHFASRFPLVGAHATADCAACHKSEQLLNFEPLSIQCIDCHNNEYTSTTKPNHISSNFSTNCEECHNVFEREWNSSGFHHNFFPLTGGHNIADCSKCHIENNYNSTPTTCFECHEADFNSTTNPAHSTSGFSTDCTICHDLTPGWKPSTFEHDPYFPIYSGKHKGEWNNCTDCHTDASNISYFSCVNCDEHSQSRMDSEHDEVSNYVFNSINCLECHPKGTED